MVKRRAFIRTVSYLMAVCVVIAVTSVSSGRARMVYEEKLEKVRFEALNSLCEYSHELSGGLSLLAVSQGDAIADSIGYVSSRAAGAIGCAACFDKEKSVNINKFLQAVYDFTQSFSADEKSRKTAAEYSDYAENLYYHLSDLSAAVMGGKYSLSEYGSVYFTQKMPYFEEFLDYSSGRETVLFGETQAVQAGGGHYEILNGKETVSLSSAREIASDIVGIDAVLWREGKTESRNGFEVYSLVYGDVAVEICKEGGLLCRLVNPVPCDETVYSPNDLLRKAEDFLKSQGYKAKPLGVKKNTFTADFYFVPEVNGILLLTAHIEVSVCLSSGEITFFDASEYIKNYRDNINFSVQMPDLSGALPAELIAEKTAVCFADVGLRERLCYVAMCSFKEESLWVYIGYSDLQVIKMQKISFTNLY